MANSNLSKAKNAKNDEFYTQYHDIQRKEIRGISENRTHAFLKKAAYDCTTILHTS